MTDTQLLTDAIQDAIQAATSEVFETMLGANITPDSTPYELVDTGVVSFVGLTGSWSGTGTVSCSPEMARLIAIRMLMLEPHEALAVDDDVLDAVAELTNMVVGNIKNILSSQLGDMAISIPTVVYGRNFRFKNLPGMSRESIMFQFENNRFEVKICLAQTAEQNPGLRVRHTEPAISSVPGRT